MYNPEIIYNRIIELEEEINNFPDSALCPIWKKELAYLKNYYI